MRSLFRKKIDPRCIYCIRSAEIGSDEVVCVKHGIVGAYSACRHFKYDPFKRTPPKPVKLMRNYSESDFSIDSSPF